MADIVEDFYGVYLLYNLNEQYKGHVYIGFTVDPNRRITQHNKGVKSGGARKTNNKGPWEMVLIVHGFPNEISALRFEWAWQNPKKSRRLKSVVSKKKRNECLYDYSVRILSEMLSIGPWNRLPLTIRWLNQLYYKEFPVDKSPPIHMPVVYGNVISKKLSIQDGPPRNESTSPDGGSNDDLLLLLSSCGLCRNPAEKADSVSCVDPTCNFIGHILCVSNHFLSADKENLIPVQGNCPRCNVNTLWGDLVRKKRGCFNDASHISPDDGGDWI